MDLLSSILMSYGDPTNDLFVFLRDKAAILDHTNEYVPAIVWTFYVISFVVNALLLMGNEKVLSCIIYYPVDYTITVGLY